jgi:integrase
MPESLTPHGLRHTFISVLFLLGEEAGYVADQADHSDALFTYNRYRKRIERRDGEPDRLRPLFYGERANISEDATSSWLDEPGGTSRRG